MSRQGRIKGPRSYSPIESTPTHRQQSHHLSSTHPSQERGSSQPPQDEALVSIASHSFSASSATKCNKNLTIPQGIRGSVVLPCYYSFSRPLRPSSLGEIPMLVLSELAVRGGIVDWTRSGVEGEDGMRGLFWKWKWKRKGGGSWRKIRLGFLNSLSE